MIKYGATVDARLDDGWTPLHVAAEGNRKDAASALLRAGAAVNARGGPQGSTPLHVAVQWNRKSAPLVLVLIEHGAGVTETDESGKTPLVCADAPGHREVVELLRKHGGES